MRIPANASHSHGPHSARHEEKCRARADDSQYSRTHPPQSDAAAQHKVAGTIPFPVCPYRLRHRSMPPRYTRTAIVLHWLIALLIVCGFCIGLTMTGLKFSPLKLSLYSYHKWIGVTIFTLA